MPIKIRCLCGNFLLAPEERIGQTGVCPSCKRSITVERPKEEESGRNGNLATAQEKPPTPKRKRSFIRFVLASFVYLTFSLLLAFIIGLHTVALTQVDKLVEKSPTVQENWLIYRDIVETVRDDQKDFFVRRVYAPIAKLCCSQSTETTKKESALSPKPLSSKDPKQPENPQPAVSESPKPPASETPQPPK